MKSGNLLVCVILLVLLAPLRGAAHGENDDPLYVAEDGADSGDCVDARAPCATLAYALSRAGKGGQILVAPGTYDVASPEDVFHLVSGVVSVTGGYLFGADEPAQRSGTSTLTGVPWRYRELIAERGFQVIADQKGLSAASEAKAEALLDIHQRLKSSIAATPCIGGNAAGLPCSDVDLLSHVGFLDVSARPSGSNDVWGFVDLNSGREYAIVGFNTGTGVFDVTDATNPREIGFIDGQVAGWRDIKVYQFFDGAADRWRAYAYVTTDGSTDGLFVIDLGGLPHGIRRVSYASDIIRAHNVYASNTDYSTGLSLSGSMPTLVIAGSSIANGRYRSYSLINPASPAFISGSDGVGYMHDAASFNITDARKDTQCVNAGAYCEVLIDFNEDVFEIWDVTTKSQPVMLSSTSYANVGYVHSGWWSEDRQFVFVHDELDERDRGLATTLRVFSVADLRNPVLVGTWTGPTAAIDHNGFVRGNRYYMSNYTRGLTILDITNPANPLAAGRLDTYPVSDSTMFNGAWGAYPFFWSGNIAISDIDSGFYMAADRTRDVPQGSVGFAAPSYATIEGQQAQLSVQRTGTSSGAVSVDYEVLHVTADASDYAVSTGTLNWADGDAADRTIAIDGVNDGVAEPLEQLLVRLVNPVGGVTLSDSNVARFYIADPGAGAFVEFDTAIASVTERGFATIVGVLKRRGSAAGAVTVGIDVAGSATPGDDFTGIVPATVSWADGDADPKWFELAVADDGILENDEEVIFTVNAVSGASIGTTDTLTVTIVNGSGPNLAPNAVAPSSINIAIGGSVTLDGSQSSDPNGDALTFQWGQTAGPAVTLANANTSMATFTAPAVQSDTMFGFELTVTDPGGLSDTAQTTVIVVRPIIEPGGGSGGSFGWVELLLLLAFALVRAFSRTDRA